MPTYKDKKSAEAAKKALKKEASIKAREAYLVIRSQEVKAAAEAKAFQDALAAVEDARLAEENRIAVAERREREEAQARFQAHYDSVKAKMEADRITREEERKAAAQAALIEGQLLAQEALKKLAVQKELADIKAAREAIPSHPNYRLFSRKGQAVLGGLEEDPRTILEKLSTDSFRLDCERIARF